MAGSGGGFTIARHRVLHVGRGRAHRASLGTSGTAGGWKPGRGPSAFFLEHLSRRSAPEPTIPASSDARSREPSPRANLFGNAPGLLAGPGLRQIAHRVFVEAGFGSLAAG